MTKIPHYDILEGLYKLRIRESEKLKAVLELYDLKIHQKRIGPDYHRLKTMVAREMGSQGLPPTLWTITETCSNREFPRVEQRNYHSLKIFIFLHGLMIWRVMQRNVWNDIVSWQTRRRNNSTKYLLHASMTTTSKKKK